MKEGWKYSTLKEVTFELFAGGDVPKPNVSKEKTSDFTIPIYTNGVEKEGLYGYTNISRVEKPAVTISARGTIGATFRRYEPFYPAIRLITAVPNTEILNIDFLYYALQTINTSKTGTSIPQLTVPNIKNISIPIPPLSEQQEIVTYLDTAFEKIDRLKENAEKSLSDAKALFQSALKEMMQPKDGWEEKTLGGITTFSQGIQIDLKNQSETSSDGKIRFLRIIDFTQGNEPPRYIDNPGSKYIMLEDDLAIVRYGASTGFVCTGLTGALANNMFQVKINDERLISKTFLRYVLVSDIFQHVIKTVMNGSAMPAISFKLINDVTIPIPPLQEQHSIVTTLDALSEKVSALEANYTKTIAECDALKQALLREVFEGS